MLRALQPQAIAHLALDPARWAAQLAAHAARHGLPLLFTSSAMVFHHQPDDRIGASRRWRPACSFMDDSAAALLALIDRRADGVVHLDSNARDGTDFDAIVRALAARFGRAQWQVQADYGHAHDQRLVGHEALMPPLPARLPTLKH